MIDNQTMIALLTGAVSTMGGVIVFLFKRTESLNKKIVELQETFREEIMSLHEKTLASLPSLERNLADLQKTTADKVVDRISSELDKTNAYIKDYKDVR